MPLRPITDSQYRFLLRFLDIGRRESATVTGVSTTSATRSGLAQRIEPTVYRLTRKGSRVVQRLVEGRQTVLQPRTTPRARRGHVNREAG